MAERALSSDQPGDMSLGHAAAWTAGRISALAARITYAVGEICSGVRPQGLAPQCLVLPTGWLRFKPGCNGFNKPPSSLSELQLKALFLRSAGPPP